MAPKKTVAVAAPAAAAEPEEIIEEIVPEPPQPERTVTFVLDESELRPQTDEDDDPEEEDEDAEGYDDQEEDDDDLDEDDEDLTTAVGQLTQLMMTEEGEAITDVLNGIRESIEKQNKILYRGLQLLEARFAPGRK